MSPGPDNEYHPDQRPPDPHPESLEQGPAAQRLCPGPSGISWTPTLIFQNEKNKTLCGASPRGAESFCLRTSSGVVARAWTAGSPDKRPGLSRCCAAQRRREPWTPHRIPDGLMLGTLWETQAGWTVGLPMVDRSGG